MQNVVQVLEKQYLEEKRTALEEQRMMYERELESLRQQLSPEKTVQQHHSSSERLAFPHATHGKLRLWTEERSVQKVQFAWFGLGLLGSCQALTRSAAFLRFHTKTWLRSLPV